MHEQIIEALRRGANDEALALARGFAAEAPDDAQAQRLLGVALQQAGAHDEALAAIDRAIELAPDEAELHFLRAGLLLGRRQIDEAQASLSTTVGLDPNQFGAYVMQAQLALARGDLAEAERQATLAGRLAPDHPWVRTLEGTLALRRGDSASALAILSRAAESAPDDVQLRYALGFAYLEQGHDAFAEQAFRGVLEQAPDAHSLRGLIAELLRRQGRFDEAVDELAPLLADPHTATPPLQRFAGELELAAGRHERALPWLRAAFAAQPEDRRVLAALLEAWRRGGDVAEARTLLDAALEASPHAADLWRARLQCEPFGSAEALAVAERWLAAMPASVPALETGMGLHAMLGNAADADALAERLVAIEPGHSRAELCLIEGLMQQDPEAALGRIDDLLARTQSAEGRPLLRSLRGLAQDRAGQPADAVATWTALHADAAPQRLPLPAPVDAITTWPPLAARPENAPAVAFLLGLPGSRVEQLAGLLQATIQSFRADRLDATPPADGFQNYDTPARLADGQARADAIVTGWREALPARGIGNGEIIDWLLWWDNALLLALRAHLPEALLLVALRDPRDMLLDWLAFGAPAPFRLESPDSAAAWLSRQLGQLATLHEQELFPHRVLRLDDVADEPQALLGLLGDALETPIPDPGIPALGPRHFPPGHWRHYRHALAAPFAALTPVAVRLGYPET
jgi:tetratricopeptide (TPR) repeat protein